MKKKFLVVHDYGTGGLWAVLTAESAEEIVQLLPEFKVLAQPPEWMGAEQLAEIERNHTYDLEALPLWLTEAIERDRAWALLVRRSKGSDSDRD